jgi:deoxyribodipyrimidine photolyase
VSLAFADATTAGKKQYAAPELPWSASGKPAPVARAKQQTGGTIVWIRHFDLRIYDNPGLLYAASLDGPVHLVFVWSDEEDAAEGKWRTSGTAASLWLYHALSALESDYDRWYGQRINFVAGKTTLAALRTVVRETGATEIVTSKAYDNAGRITDEEVQHGVEADHVKFQSFNSFLLNDVDSIRIDMKERRGHFGTLVPFLFACNAQPQPPKPQGAPATLPRADIEEVSCNVGLHGLGLCRLPVRKDGSVLNWAAPIVKEWKITEEAGYAALRAFLALGGGLSKYEADRHLADASAVARISPYLRYGMLSCRTVYWEASAENAKEVATTFWRRLVWRDLAYWQLRLFPGMAEQPIRDHYIGQKWSTDKNALNRWCQGRTGYPLVDAGMRELWATGWMHQNVRMVVALFLVEYLNIHWVEGARWFHHTLVDADPAINPMMWQNAGKSGLDQWNFTMHPAEFGRRVDPTGNYVRRWCPELSSLPPRFIHCPWEAPQRLQKHIPVGIYPTQLVENLGDAALRSISAILDQRARRKDRNDDRGYDTIVLPKGSTLADDGRRVPLFTKKDYRLPLRARMYDDDRNGSAVQYEKRRPDSYNAVLADYIHAHR